MAFPAWVLGHDPSKRVLCASYSDVLAGELSRDCRRVMESEWYRRVFPRTRISVEKNSETHFVTTAQGHRYATSTGGSITGMGGDIIIVDDPIKSDEALSETRRTAINEWFDRTLSTRLDRPADGVIIVIMQRLALEDLAGHVLQKGNWTHLNFPAIATTDKLISIGDGLVHQRTIGEVLHPQHISRERLAEKKKEMGSFHFSAQYQQDPVPAEGEIIKWSWFRFYRSPLIPQCGDQIVQSWDTAYKAKTTSDFSVCTTWLVRGNLKHLIDVLREKLDYPSLKRKVVEHALRQHAEAVLVEDKGSGTSLIYDLRNGGTGIEPMAIPITPESDKITRMAAQSAKIESGQVLLPLDAPWLEDFRVELLQFPHGRHDDQVDSLSQFLAWESRAKSRFVADFGKYDGAPATRTAEPVRPTPARILVRVVEHGREVFKRWDPDRGFCE